MILAKLMPHAQFSGPRGIFSAYKHYLEKGSHIWKMFLTFVPELSEI